jgi:hypothetical protein
VPDAFHVFLLATNAAGVCLSAVFLNRARRHALAADRSAKLAGEGVKLAAEGADLCRDAADIATRHANRAAREATRAINANDARARAASFDDEPDVIPFTRPAATGPRLADLDDRPA